MDTAPTSSEPAPRSAVSMVLWIVGMVVAAAALVFASRAAASWYLSLSATNDTVNCAKAGAGHFVVIHNSQADPAATTGTLCDTLTIINKDPKLRVMAFGPHDHHIAYDGVTEQTLAENQSMTITFNKLGTYTFHDHVDDSSIGTFTVLSR